MFVIFGCESNTGNKEAEVLTDRLENDSINIDEEYAVINQILPQLGESCILCDYQKLRVVPPPPSSEHDDSWELEFFNKNYEFEARKLIYKKLSDSKIDSSKIDLWAIEILVISDSFLAFSNLPALPIDLNKINRPDEAILITSNDSLFKYQAKVTGPQSIQHESFSFSRVKFNKEKNKASFQYGYIWGGLSGNGVLINCELKNGAWVIVDRKTIWVS